MKTPDEIKKGLECCSISYADCNSECPYKRDCDGSQILKDALALIQQLEAENDRLKDDVCREYNIQDELKERIHQLEAERDAAVEDMESMAAYVVDDVCEWCAQTAEGCKHPCNFKWRGVQKEE